MLVNLGLNIILAMLMVCQGQLPRGTKKNGQIEAAVLLEKSANSLL